MRLGRRPPRCRAPRRRRQHEAHNRPDGLADTTQPKLRRLDDPYNSPWHDGHNPGTTKVLAGLSGHPSTSVVSPGSRRPTGTANAHVVCGHIRSGHTETSRIRPCYRQPSRLYCSSLPKRYTQHRMMSLTLYSTPIAVDTAGKITPRPGGPTHVSPVTYTTRQHCARAWSPTLSGTKNIWAAYIAQ